MRGKKILGTVALLSAVVVAPIMCWAQNDVVQHLESGSINWSSAKVTAKGIGAPPADAVNMAQARMMARRAAVLDARRNLLETTQGVQVDSVTLVKNAIVQSDLIRNSVQGVIKNAQVIDTAYMSDGSVEVTMVMSLTGEFADVILPKPPMGSQGAELPPMPTPPPGASGAQAPLSQVFTGLVVDARGLGTRPAMSPKVLDADGKEIYGSAMVDREYAVQQGMAGYAKDLSAAQSNSRVTDNPLTVKALKVSGAGKSDLVISNSDAGMLSSASENLSFLQKCRVMVVLD